jgi:hypothetical protein
MLRPGKVELYLHSLLRLHGKVINYRSTGETFVLIFEGKVGLAVKLQAHVREDTGSNVGWDTVHNDRFLCLST